MSIFFKGREYNDNFKPLIFQLDGLSPIEYAKSIILECNKLGGRFNDDIYYQSNSAEDRTAALILIKHFTGKKIHFNDISIEKFDKNYPYSNYPFIHCEKHISGYVNVCRVLYQNNLYNLVKILTE